MQRRESITQIDIRANRQTHRKREKKVENIKLALGNVRKYCVLKTGKRPFGDV